MVMLTSIAETIVRPDFVSPYVYPESFCLLIMRLAESGQCCGCVESRRRGWSGELKVCCGGGV